MQVSALYRHPLKGHGRESLPLVTLHAGQAMPFDRLWAVAHTEAKVQAGIWAGCQHFSIGSKAPALTAINAVLDEATEKLTLGHPALPDLTFDPDTEAEAFLAWVRPLVPENRAQPAGIYRLDERGFTDTDFASISLCNLASHAEVCTRAGTDLSALRWRCNIWFKGAEAWQESDWLDREITLGTTVLKVREPIVRCLATAANPATGQRDIDMLGLLNGMRGNKHFGVYAEVLEGGVVKVGDSMSVI